MFGDLLAFGFNSGSQFNTGGFNFNFGNFGNQFNTGGFNFGDVGGHFAAGAGFNFNFGGPIAVARGAFKVAENESPRPEDRVFGTYNYYNDVQKAGDVHRETVGFEKTFLAGAASLELRLPFFEMNGDNGVDHSEVSDLNIQLKYALLDDPGTGSLLALGFAVTTPTGPDPYLLLPSATDVEKVHDVLLQPFVGYLWNGTAVYFHGFTAVLVATDARDVSALTNDVGLGWWLYRGGGLLSSVIPTFEVHVNTPLNHRSFAGLPEFRDSVDLTAGSYVGFAERALLGIAVGTPVTGPRLFAVETLVNFNWRF
jgi:hypothetical protein